MKGKKKQITIAMLVSILLLVASFTIASAAPAAQASKTTLSLGIAFIVGIFYYISMSPWTGNLGFTVFYRPLIAGTLVGLIMGRPAEGIAIGANINVLYLGWISAGGSLPGDPGLAGYLGTALVLGSGLDVKASLAVAAPLGLLGGLTWSLRMSLCSIIPHWADKFAEEGNIKAVARSNYIYSQPFLFVIYAIPVMIVAYYGSQVLNNMISWLAFIPIGDGKAASISIMGGLYAASGALAALGIALNMKFLLRGNVWPYYFVGFVVVSMMTKVNLLMMAVIGAALAYVHVLFTMGFGEKAAATQAEDRKGPNLLTKNDVFKAFVRWLFFSHSTYNWERMQGMGFVHSMTPIIEKLYHTKEDITAALKRHLIFFNTQPDMGGIIHGVVIAMEEEKAGGADITDDAINGVKTGLMGPMAGIGDTIQQGIVIPILLAIGMSVATGGQVGTATQGNFLGPFLFLIGVAAFVWGVGWTVFWQGYKQGRTAVTNLLQSGLLNRLIVGAGVLGNFIMGALTVQFVKLSTPIAFKIGGTAFKIQDILNSFMPNLLPLILVLVIWWLLTKKNVSPTWVMIGILVIVGVLSALQLPMGLSDKGEIIKVGFFGS